MFVSYLKRGLGAGAIGGMAYGLFVALVGRHVLALAAAHGHGHAHAGLAVGSTGATVGASVLLGVFFGGLAFGVGHYLLEPALPGTTGTQGVLLGAAGFLSASGVPWLVFPPQPPGLEPALPAGTRLAWYGLVVVASLLAFALAVLAYDRRGARSARCRTLAGAAVALAALAGVVVAAPSAHASGSVPPAVAAGFRSTVAFGQLHLWSVTAVAYAWLDRRATAGPEPETVAPAAAARADD